MPPTRQVCWLRAAAGDAEWSNTLDVIAEMIATVVVVVVVVGL